MSDSLFAEMSKASDDSIVNEMEITASEGEEEESLSKPPLQQLFMLWPYWATQRSRNGTPTGNCVYSCSSALCVAFRTVSVYEPWNTEVTESVVAVPLSVVVVVVVAGTAGTELLSLSDSSSIITGAVVIISFSVSSDGGIDFLRRLASGAREAVACVWRVPADHLNSIEGGTTVEEEEAPPPLFFIF